MATESEKTSLSFVLATLRHAYENAANGRIVDQQAFAKGLLAPAIKELEYILDPVYHRVPK